MSTHDELVGPTNAFVSAVTPLVRGLAGDVHDADPDRWVTTVITEACDLMAAIIDSDAVHTDNELAAFTVAAGPHLRSDLSRATPDTLRRSGIVAGRRVWLENPSDLFRLLVDADRKHGGRRSWIYYLHALDLAHAVAAVDVHTSRAELDAIARLRSQLLARIHEAGIKRPPVTFFTGPKGRPEPRDRVPLDPSRPPPVAPGSTNADGTPRHTDDTTNDGAAPGAYVPGESGAATDDGSLTRDNQALTIDRDPPRPVEVLLEELDELVGLDPVKAEVKLVANLLIVQKLRADRGLPTAAASRHLVFTGNPGTGKTTVGRLLAEIYASLGVLRDGHLVEADRSALVAGFVGQTATRTREVCDKARHGMLLIDEAYALARGNENDFGREAIDTLVKYMEDHRDEIVIVVAGYPDEMATFVGANPGLSSRFPKTIHFPDYTSEELTRIFELIARKNHYRLTEDAREAVRAYFETKDRGKGFGNGRDARNLFEASIARQATRLVAERGLSAAAQAAASEDESLTDDVLMALTVEDVTGAPTDEGADDAPPAGASADVTVSGPGPDATA